MCGKFCQALVVAVIGGMMLSMIEVDAHSTVNNSASCESSTFTEAVDLIKQGMNNVELIREDLKAVSLIGEDVEDVKNLLGSNQQQNNVSSIKEDLEDLKTAFASAQQQNNASSIKKDLENIKTAVDASAQQQNKVTSILKKELEDLKAAVSACVSNQQLPSTANVSSLCEYKLRARLGALVAAVCV